MDSDTAVQGFHVGPPADALMPAASPPLQAAERQGFIDMKTKFMRKILMTCVTSGLLFSAGAALADADLFKKSNCMACHAVDQKRFGPSLKEVAAKYAGDSAAAGMLAKKIQAGGAGVWGQIPMPPQPQVSDADALRLAEYVLSIQ